MDIITLEHFTVIMFFIGFYGVIVSRNIIKSIIFITVMETAVIMFFISIGYREGIRPPIGYYYLHYEYVADPLPQALMITAIIIGLAVTAVNITMLITLFRQYKTTHWDIASKKAME